MLSDLYYVEWFELRCMICTALNYLYSTELFVVQCWIICITLNDLYNVEWFFTSSSNLCHVEWFVQHWKMCTTFNDSGCDGWFVQRSIIWATMNYWVSAFTLIPELIFPDLKISRRNIFGSASEIGHKEMFLITLEETIINVFSRHI